MIETLGFPALVAAADAAAKAADVKIVTYQGADAGIVTIFIIGDVSSVQSAVAVGEAEAKRVGQLRHSHVIARPDQSVPKVIVEMLKKEQEKQQAQEPEEKLQAQEQQEMHENQLDKQQEKEPEQPAESVPELQQELVEESAELAKKSINELRKLAYAHANFPLNSQEITIAKKEELIKYLSEMEREKVAMSRDRR